MSEVQREPTEAFGAPPGPAPAVPEGELRASAGPSGPRSGFWRRFAALVVDSIIVGIVQSLLVIIFQDSAGVAYAISTIITWTYYTLLEGGARGQTVGGMALSIRIIDFNGGGPIGYGRAFIRQIVKIISGLVF